MSNFLLNSDSGDNGILADSSDTDIIFASRTPPAKSHYVILQPERLIDTKDVTMPEECKKNRLSRSKGIRKYWNELALGENIHGSSDSIRYLTNKYVNYIGEKLAALYYKYTSSPRSIKVPELNFFPGIPTVQALIELFNGKQMSNLIDMYYYILNEREDTRLEQKCTSSEDERHNVGSLFKMLEKEFTDKYKESPFTDLLVDEYKDEVQ